MIHIQSNFNGSNTFGTMKISSRQRLFDPRGLIIAPGQEAKKGYLFDILEREGILCVLIRIASSRRF